jgi:single-stranded-DNA-specific exonuclease
LAAGFTIGRENIPRFAEEMAKLCRAFRQSDACRTALEVDCEVTPDLLTLPLVDALEELEPCGTACPKPILMLRRAKVEQLSAVGGGKHLRLRLNKGGRSFGSICFSTTAADLSVSEGDLVDVVFQPQVNEFRGNRSVQLNLVDLRQIDAVRQQEEEAASLYADLCRNESACPEHAPRREDFVQLWKYLSQNQTESEMVDSWGNLCRRAARQSGKEVNYLRARLCLDVFCEMGLITLREQKNLLHIALLRQSHKVDLEESQLLQRWRGIEMGELS